jgi:diguanylate cyclase (GGDEF)-like protein
VTNLPLYVFLALLCATAFACVGWRLRSRLARRALDDGLTGLANRRLFDMRVAHAIVRAKRHGHQVAVLSIDIDELATVNNLMGRECGDQLLREVSDRLRQLARAEDTIARISSDEFAILLEQVDGPTAAARAAHRILDAFQVPMTIDGRAIAVSVSIGMSISGASDEPHVLLSEAGLALARAKARGKHRLETYEPPMGVEAAKRFTLEAELRQAVSQGELAVHYQPIFDVSSDTIVGAEALARWHHPQHGLLLPGDFITVAEQSGAIVEIGSAVLTAACRVAAAFTERGVQGFQMSVNVSPLQFRDSDGLISDVSNALLQSGLAPQSLTLEITESSLLDDIDGAIAVVQRLRSTGVNVVLDDFGTGFSSLSYIKNIPVSGLKLDQSFIADLCQPRTATVIRAILDIAREFGMSVTAEGVESDEQLAALRTMGCRMAQGRYYSDAVPEAALLRMTTGPLRRHNLARLSFAHGERDPRHEATA